MTNIESMLVEFHRQEAARPFCWGVSDCSLRLADWWNFVHQADPAASLRGTYHSRLGAKVAAGRAGGLLRLVTSLAESVGAEFQDGLCIGAFGVAVVAGEPRGFIATADMISIRSESGVAFIRPEKAAFSGIWGIV